MRLASLVRIALMLASAYAGAATDTAGAEEVVNLDTRPGVKVRMLVSRVERGAGTVILLAGGDGVLDISDTGRIRTSVSDNQLVRTRGDYNRAGLATIVPDVAPDIRTHPGSLALPQHAQDLGFVIRYARDVAGPVWLIGTSRSAVAVAAAMTRQNLIFPDGIVITSGQLMHGGVSAQLVGHLDRIKVPVLLVGHRNDSCPTSPSGDIEKFKRLLVNAPKVDVVLLNGGGPNNPGADRCGSNHYHGYLGIEGKLVSTVTSWIKANTPDAR